MTLTALLVLVVLYFVPLMVALARGHNPGGVAIVNVLLGWTFIGWVVALVMACGAKREPVTVVQQMGAPAGPVAAVGAPGGFCSGCGAPLTADAAFCPKCGRSRTRAPSSPPTTPESPAPTVAIPPATRPVDLSLPPPPNGDDDANDAV